MRRLLNILVLLIVLVFCALFFALKSSYFALKIEERSKIILVQKGDNIRKISERLDVDKIYEKPFVSYVLMRLLSGGAVYVGEYEVVKGESLLDFISKLKNKVFYYRKITFVEGETVQRYKDQINSAFGFMGDITEEMKEGYFMAGTYNYLYGEAKDDLVKRAKADTLKFVTEEFAKVSKEGFYLKNINEVLSLASVVEKESAIGLERGLIAGVFYNRLMKGMKLQSDPTTIYEITKGKFKLNRALTYDDLKMAGEYNTYYIKGIPVSPIATPSKEAILAVLSPQKTDSLFFVADGIGGHNFSDNYEDHKQNVQKYKQVLKKSNE